MEELKVGFRKFEIIEKYDSNDLKLKRKNKFYYAKFYSNAEEFDNDIYAINRLNSAMVLIPEVKCIDKKHGIIITEFHEEQSVLDYMSKNDVTEKMYSNIFTLAKMARLSGLSLDFTPENWIITKDGLMYTSKRIYDYSKENEFTQRFIRYWFMTKEFVKHAEARGYGIDNSRLKDPYVTNKEIVLMTCKFYS